jgi:hypothetical protein
MGENYPWSKLNDDQIPPGTLDPNKFPIRPSKPSQRWWNDYWYNNPHGGLISPSPGAPSPTPWVGFSENGPSTRENLETGGGSGGGAGGGGGNKSVKTATPDVEINAIKLKDDLLVEELQQLFLTDIGGRELAVLSRHDQINGISQEYSPIKNLSDISLQYNPLAISPNADNVTTYLTSFNFDITKYIPTQQELNAEYPLEADASKRTVVYFDKETNSLNIHVKNIFVNEKIEVEFIVPEEVKDGTIYT